MENHHMVILNILNIGMNVNVFQKRINILLIINNCTSGFLGNLSCVFRHVTISVYMRFL